MLRVWLSGCLLISGACALIYEIAWLRLLALTLGNTAYATSCILSVFLGGLALGAYFGGKLADERKWTGLSTYGIVEIAIGLSAPVTTVLLTLSPVLVVAICKSMPDSPAVQTTVKIAISAVLLLPATMLMGATLPIVIKLVQRQQKESTWFAWLYGMNTLGAVLGSFSAALLGFSYLGITMTTVSAGIANCCIGIGSLLMSRKLSNTGDNASDEQQREPDASQSVVVDTAGDARASAANAPTPSGSVHGNFMLYLSALSFLCGYTAVSYEVLWTRMMRFFTGSLTYAFSVMLGMFLLGLAAGSFLYKSKILPMDSTNEQRFARFANWQYLAAIACAGSLIGVPICLVIPSIFTANPLTNPWPMMFNIAVKSAVIILLPATLIGTLFPLLGTISSETQKSVGKSVGIAYAANTAGCVLGSLVTGLLLMPTIGSYKAFQLTVVLSTITGCLAMAAAHVSAKKLFLTGVVPVLLAVLFMASVYVPYMKFISIDNGTVLKEGEDAIGTMVITDFKPDTQVLVFNGSSLATTAMPSRRYMRMLAHMPILLHDAPKEVMVACFGTGTTCGAACSHPSIDSVHVVELSKMIFESGDFFQSNGRVLHNPKLKSTITDARNFLLLTDKKFDVITFEPPPPCDAGIVNLYTTEFYRLVKAHLKPGGMMSQWVPLHDASVKLWKMQVQSAAEVFPYTSVWLPNSGEALLLCSDSPPKYDIDMMQKRMTADERVKANLHEVGFDTPADMLAAFVTDGSDLSEYIQQAETITDDKPSLEFFHPYSGPLIPDDELFAVGGFSKKPFASRSDVQNSRQSLQLLFKKTANQQERVANLKAAQSLVPGNNWFHWLLDMEKR